MFNELSNIFGETTPEIELHGTLFEDNNEALELATKPRYCPRIKHIAIKYHHFCKKVQKGFILIKAIDTREQIVGNEVCPNTECEKINSTTTGTENTRTETNGTTDDVGQT